MHTVTQPMSTLPTGAAATRTRVAVAGATGYTGQELLRLLARHPSVSIAAAMGSAAASTTSRLESQVSDSARRLLQAGQRHCGSLPVSPNCADQP